MNAEKMMLSFFERKNILVIVPHQDDEINVAGSLIFQINKIARCKVVFMTNGDCYVDAARRQKEAEKALACLGIKKKNIIYMGYPDVASFQEKCVCHTYNKQNYLRDLKQVILDERPDYIITNDMDKHPNHIELSVMIEEALGEILKEDVSYKPKLLKTYAYDLAFYGISDYSAYNLKESKTQNTGLNPSLKWENRLRIPVPAQARTKMLTRNIIYKSMWKHHSQSGFLFASRIANSDKVYWLRRTDSIAYNASIVASSGRVKYLNDFRITFVKEDMQLDYTKLWYPEKNDNEKKFRLSFQQKADIGKVVLYENMLLDNHIINGRLVFSNGYVKNVDNIENDGSASSIDVDNQKDIAWIEFQITESVGDFAGLTEIEVYEPKIKKVWFIKICINNNFVYKYYTNETNINPSVLMYDTDGNILDDKKEKIHIVYEEKGQEREIVGALNIEKIKRKIVIKAFCENNPDVYDQVVIIRNNMDVCERIINVCNQFGEAFYKGIDWIINEMIRMKQVGMMQILKQKFFQ